MAYNCRIECYYPEDLTEILISSGSDVSGALLQDIRMAAYPMEEYEAEQIGEPDTKCGEKEAI
jgi:hypothetical protein